jgi:hypothetical protein
MQQQSKESGIGECPVDMTTTASAAITAEQSAPASAHDNVTNLLQMWLPYSYTWRVSC